MRRGWTCSIFVLLEEVVVEVEVLVLPLVEVIAMLQVSS